MIRHTTIHNHLARRGWESVYFDDPIDAYMLCGRAGRIAWLCRRLDVFLQNSPIRRYLTGNDIAYKFRDRWMCTWPNREHADF